MIRKACDSCYKQKKRCEGTRPCSTCHRLGKICTYTKKEKDGSIVSERQDLPNISTLKVDPLTPEIARQLEERFFTIPSLVISREQFVNAKEFIKLAAYALAARERDLHAVVSHAELYSSARAQFDRFMEDESNHFHGSMDIIMACKLLSAYEFSIERFYRAWHTSGSMCRCITADCINFLDSKRSERWRRRTEEETDEARLAFWNAFHTDRMASMATDFTPCLATNAISTYLCDERGRSTGRRIEDDWQGQDLPLFAYIAIAATFWEETGLLSKECYGSRSTLTENEILTKYEARSRYLTSFQEQTSRVVINTSEQYFIGFLLQTLVQAACIQFYVSAISHGLSYKEQLKHAAFRAFLHLGSIDADLGIYNNLLCYTLFRAGTSLLELYTDQEPEIWQGLTILSSMLERLALVHPGAGTFVKELRLGMEGKEISGTITEFIRSNQRLEVDDFDTLLKMWAQTSKDIQDSLAIAP